VAPHDGRGVDPGAWVTWRLFGTEYTPPGGGLYCSQIWAKSKAHARQLCHERGLGETLAEFTDTPPPRASEYFARAMSNRVRRKPRHIDIVHALAWVGLLAVQSRRAAPVDVLGDRGFLHEAVHWLAFGSDDVGKTQDGWREVLAAIERVEERLPGFLPPPRLWKPYDWRRAR
jgi:hypothetical protein